MTRLINRTLPRRIYKQALFWIGGDKQTAHQGSVHLANMSVSPVIVVHGGAGTHASILLDKIARKAVDDGVVESVRRGYSVLKSGGSAVDAVQMAVAYMEDNPTFNAGKGSYYTTQGTIEMDATIMDGKTLNSGGVACVENITNPINLARLVMDKSDHVLLVGEGAKTFARAHGMPIIPTEDLKTLKADGRMAQFRQFNPSAKAEFSDLKLKKPKVTTSDANGSEAVEAKGTDQKPKKPKLTPDPSSDDHDTVGAVALDSQGNVAYANSTGGINAKMPGRCGDSALVGCGGYCDNSCGANATTGLGEAFVKTCLGRHICYLMERGHNPQKAVEEGLQYMVTRVGGFGGAIAVNPQGEIGISFTTDGMSWASIKQTEEKVHYGIYVNEDMVVDI